MLPSADLLEVNTKSTRPYAVMFLRARYLGHADGPALERAMIERQRQECQAIADELGVQVIREYVEHGGTGAIAKRPELRLMLEELRLLKDVAYVITVDPERLARRGADRDAINFELKASGAKLATKGGIYGEEQP
jgi:DNA invertase Pin-like site-specific DNA recombinase